MLIGVHRDDTIAEAEYLADKLVKLRIFPDDRTDGFTAHLLRHRPTGRRLSP